jgi:hypothetical protein
MAESVEVWNFQEEVEMRSSVVESSKAETATEIDSRGTVLALTGFGKGWRVAGQTRSRSSST